MIATILLAWLAIIIFIVMLMLGVGIVGSARTAAAQQYWNSEGRVIAEAQLIVSDAARDLEER